MKNRIISATMILLFLGVMFGGFLHMSSGMDMSLGMADCPFASNKETICPMSAADHITEWKEIFLSVLPNLTLLLLLAAIIPNLLSKRMFANFKLREYKKEFANAFTYRPLQELFSSGILHPKLFN
jgi:hypothetical protein